MFTLTIDKKDSTVRISGELLINDVEEFYGKMEDLLNKGKYVTFDLSGLEAVDISALQVLLSYKKSLPEESRFSISQASENVKKTLKLVGFAQPLHFLG